MTESHFVPKDQQTDALTVGEVDSALRRRIAFNDYQAQVNAKASARLAARTTVVRALRDRDLQRGFPPRGLAGRIARQSGMKRRYIAKILASLARVAV